MTIRLRPHHLLCLQTYAGKGYSAAFVANYDAIALRIAAGEAIEIIDGPDDICAPLLDGAEPHCFRDSVIERDRQAARDLEPLLDIPIVPGAAPHLTEGALRALRAAFAQGQTRQACKGCEWSDLCSTIAGTGFPGVAIPA